MKMPDKEYNEALNMVKHWAGTKKNCRASMIKFIINMRMEETS